MILASIEYRLAFLFQTAFPRTMLDPWHGAAFLCYTQTAGKAVRRERLSEAVGRGCTADSDCTLDSVYLDFQKAFDKVPHGRLLTELYKLQGSWEHRKCCLPICERTPKAERDCNQPKVQVAHAASERFSPPCREGGTDRGEVQARSCEKDGAKARPRKDDGGARTGRKGLNSRFFPAVMRKQIP